MRVVFVNKEAGRFDGDGVIAAVPDLRTLVQDETAAKPVTVLPVDSALRRDGVAARVGRQVAHNAQADAFRLGDQRFLNHQPALGAADGRRHIDRRVAPGLVNDAAGVRDKAHTFPDQLPGIVETHSRDAGVFEQFMTKLGEVPIPILAGIVTVATTSANPAAGTCTCSGASATVMPSGASATGLTLIG